MNSLFPATHAVKGKAAGRGGQDIGGQLSLSLS